MTTVHVPNPGRQHMPGLVLSITRDLAREWKLGSGTLPVLPESYCRGKGVNARQLRRAILKFTKAWTAEYLDRAKMY